MNREVMIVTGAGQISMAIARRIGYGKKIRCNCGNSKPYLKKCCYIQNTIDHSQDGRRKI